MNGSRWVDVQLAPTTLGSRVSMRLGDFDERWVAIVGWGSATSEGLGGSARQALVAALAPFGTRATATLMADPVMFAASAKLLSRVGRTVSS
jgi:hypothetical protein